MLRYKLVIGNRNYSSWSLRVWLHLKASHEEFEVVMIPLYHDNYKEKLLELSPAGRVPILIDNNNHHHTTTTTTTAHGADSSSTNTKLVIWDSLSIMEHVREQAQAQALLSSSTTIRVIGWPENVAARAHARSIAQEFHAGFLAIRDELPQNLRRIKNADTKEEPLAVIDELSESCRQQIARVHEIWKTCYETYNNNNNNHDNNNNNNNNTESADGGDWLFGSNMTIADIMYVPVALRFVAYGIPLDNHAPSQRFIRAVLANYFVQEWMAEAQQEPYSLEFIDHLVPAAQSPMIL